jgi:hypothetical protein
MRRSISTLFTTLLLSIAILPVTVQAQTTRTESTSLNPYAANQSSTNPPPFNLAYLAYQGYLKAEGIPSSGGLDDAIASGRITAQDIMQAAVNANRFPKAGLTDQAYRHELENVLQGLAED